MRRALLAALAWLGLAGAAVADPAPPTPPAPTPGAPWPANTVSIRTGGMVADFFTPLGTSRRLPAIILLGGSEGGLNSGVAYEAHLLVLHGYAVLQLAYFGADGLPPKLELVPLEYFKRAIDWLQARPDVDPDRIGLEGTSIGGETALVVAAHDPRIKVVVAAVPSSVVWPGIDPADPNVPSTFTLGGQPLPDLPYGWTGTFQGVYQLYADGLTDVGQHPDAVIPVERINGPILLVCGKDDALWPSCPMSEQIMARLKANHFALPVGLMSYAHAGHAAFGPPLDPANPHFADIAQLGGTPEGNNAARNDAWPISLAFLDQALKGP